MRDLVSEKRMRICRTDDVSKHLSRIDPLDADADFYNDVSKNREQIYAVSDEEKTVGLVCIRDDTESFIYVYIFREDRNLGYGSWAVSAAEQQLRSVPLLSIGTAYDSANEIARSFAEKCGYVKKFSTSVMKYHGKPFEIPELPIRKYEDRDFLEAYTMSAEAFHVMRLETGHDPNSVPYAPDDEARQYCAETAEGRYVYEVDDEIVGCAYIDGAEIALVSIGISHQGKGLGRNLVKFMVNEILEKGIGEPFLYCLGVNEKARRLYDSLGFREIACNAYAVKNLGNESTR